MEVILQSEVATLGREGDVVNVARGYANNFLIPKKLAVLATSGNLRQLEEKRAGIEKRHATARSDAEGVAKKIDGKSVTIMAKAGEGGRLYGSVTAKDVAAAIQEEFGIEVDRRRISPADPIKEAGEVKVSVKISVGVEASVVVKVVADVQDTSETAPDSAEPMEAAESVDVEDADAQITEAETGGVEEASGDSESE